MSLPNKRSSWIDKAIEDMLARQQKELKKMRDQCVCGHSRSSHHAGLEAPYVCITCNNKLKYHSYIADEGRLSSRIEFERSLTKNKKFYVEDSLQCGFCLHSKRQHKARSAGASYCQACTSGTSNHTFYGADKDKNEEGVVTMTTSDMVTVSIPREVDFDLVDIISKMDGRGRDEQVAILVRLTAKAFLEGVKHAVENEPKAKGKKK